MTTPDAPQIYLITPPAFDVEAFAPRLSAVLDARPVACVRLDLLTRDEDILSRAADQLRTITDARDVALVVRDHVKLVERLGLDGVHLSDGARHVRATRKTLGADAIVGAYCGTSRHDGMSAGEAGADYVSFGPVGGDLGGGLAEFDLFDWWSQMIEVPVVAEGGISAGRVADLAAVADFLGFGEEIWADDDPVAALARLLP